MVLNLLSLEWQREISRKNEYRCYITHYFLMADEQIKGKKSAPSPCVTIIIEKILEGGFSFLRLWCMQKLDCGHALCLQHVKGEMKTARMKPDMEVCFSLLFLAIGLHSGLAHPGLASWCAVFSFRLREKVLSVLTCFVFLHIKNHWTKLFLPHSGEFQVEAYCYHPEEQARHPDTWLNLFIIRCSLTMAMWWRGRQPSTTQFSLASRK